MIYVLCMLFHALVVFTLCYVCRAVARSENLGRHVVLGGDNVPTLVEVGLTDLQKKTEGGGA